MGRVVGGHGERNVCKYDIHIAHLPASLKWVARWRHRWSTLGGLCGCLIVRVQKRITIINAKSWKGLVLLPVFGCC